MSTRAADPSSTCAGSTIIELLVVLLVMSIIAGVSAVAIRGPGSAPQEGIAARLAAGRDAALRSGEPVVVADSGGGPPTLFLPDGRSVGPDADPLTGEAIDAAPR